MSVNKIIFKYRYVLILIFIVVILAITYLFSGDDKSLFDDFSTSIDFTTEEKNWIKNNPIINVGVDLDFAPIEYLDKDNKYVGVASDFLTLVEKRTGLTFKIDQERTWVESIERVKTGEIQMLGAAVPSEQRRQYMDFTLSYASLSGVIIVKKSVTEHMSLDKLNGMKVAVVKDYIWKDLLEVSHPEIDISASTDVETTIKKVSFGMVDAMVGYMATASHHIERLGISNLKISGDTLSVMNICFATSKKNPILKNILDKVLQEATDEQKKLILRKWISLQLNKPTDLEWFSQILFPWVFLGLLGFIGITIWNRSLQRQVVQRTENLNKELVQRKQVEQALRESEEKYRSIFGNIQDVYFEILPHGEVLEISPSIKKVLGYDRGVILQSVLSFIFFNQEDFEEMREKVIQMGRLADHEISLVRPGGERLICSINAMLVKNSQDHSIKIIGSIRNISDRVKAQRGLKTAYHELEKRVRERTAELRNTNKELKLAKEAADAATLAKSNFLANMSHEIRTPLSGVISASELVMSEAPPGKIARYINIIRGSANALLEVIDDILDFSKIEAGKLEIEIHQFHMNQLLSRATSLFKHKFAEKEITFIVDIKPDTPVNLKGDSFRLQQIITNLLSNAFKFTDRGGEICLSVSSTPIVNEDVLLTFQVSDNGIGINPEHQDLLFTPFSQVDASTTRKYGGSGLGLSICGQLVEMMGGSISVNSCPERGSKFVFSIPIRVMESLDPKQIVGPSQLDQAVPISKFRELLEGKKILVAEDTPTNQEIILAILELAGIETTLADTGLRALEAVQNQVFDAILMDIQMPEMDGFETTREIRRYKENASLPIIAMTAHTLKDDESKCLSAGMDGYISKPVNQEKLFNALILFIHKKDLGKISGSVSSYQGVLVNGAADRVVDSSESLPKKVPGIEIERAVNAIGVNDDVFFQILQTFFVSYEHIVQQIKSAWFEGDRDVVVGHLHSLKGSAIGIGAVELHGLVVDLEKTCRRTTVLPVMEKASLVSLQNAMTTVLASIKMIVKERDSQKKEAPPVMVNLVEAAKTLERLEEVLKFPEIEELEILMKELESVFENPHIAELKKHITSHDHELAGEIVIKLQTILEGRSLEK